MKIAFSCVLATLLFAGLAMADWDLIYEFNQLPEDTTPAWEAKNNNEPNGTQGSIIADPDNPENNIYYINDLAGAKTGRIVPLEVDLSVGLTIVVRMKCASGGHVQSFNIGWYDEDYTCAECVLWPDHFQLGRGSDTPITAEFDIDGSEWHVYRITAAGNDVTVYVDESAEPKVGPKTLEDAGKGNKNPGIAIGSQSTSGAQEIYFDYLLVDLSGTYAPGEGTPIPGATPVETAGKLSITWGLLKTR